MAEREDKMDPWAINNAAWIKNTRAAGTSKAYEPLWNDFEYFCNCNGKKALPAAASTAVMFMRYQAQVKGLARNTINKVSLAAIADRHALLGFTSPTTEPVVRKAKRAIKEITRAPKTKEPMGGEHLVSLIRVMESDSPLDNRDMFLFILMFWALLRESEAMFLKTDDVFIRELDGVEYLVVMVAKDSPTKTDRKESDKGDMIIIAKNDSNPLLCPVRWYRRWVSIRGNHKSPFLFADLAKPASRRAMNKQLPNTRLKVWLRRSGVNVDLFSSHSLRHGGATAAANAGVAYHLLKGHGRWKSECVQVYIHRSLSDRLSVSVAMQKKG
jgi:site-specific recombinase XerD